MKWGLYCTMMFNLCTNVSEFAIYVSLCKRNSESYVFTFRTAAFISGELKAVGKSWSHGKGENSALRLIDGVNHCCLQ